MHNICILCVQDSAILTDYTIFTQSYAKYNSAAFMSPLYPPYEAESFNNSALPGFQIMSAGRFACGFRLVRLSILTGFPEAALLRAATPVRTDITPSRVPAS